MAIGKGNALAWDMPADRDFFMEQIRGHDVVMGRLTFESHHSEDPIPYRKAIVITRRKDYQVEGAIVCASLEQAYEIAQQRGEQELFILGGGVIYDLAIKDADRLVITEIHTTLDGDAYFPEIDPNHWREVARDAHPSDAENPFAYEFVEYAAKSASS